MFADCTVDVTIDVYGSGVQGRRHLDERQFRVIIDGQVELIRPENGRLRTTWQVPSAEELIRRFGNEGPHTIAVRVDAPDGSSDGVFSGEGESRVFEVQAVAPGEVTVPVIECFWLEQPETDPQVSIGTLHVVNSASVTSAWMTQIVLYEEDWWRTETRWIAPPRRQKAGGPLAVTLSGELPILEGHDCEYRAVASLIPATDVVRWTSDGEYGPEPAVQIDSEELWFGGPCIRRQVCDVSEDGLIECVESQGYDFVPGSEHRISAGE